MYNAGQLQLQSANWLNSHTGDRPSFHATVSRTFSSRTYHVFAMTQGLLFLRSKRTGKGSASDEEQQRAMMMGYFFGGVIGAAIGQAIANSGSPADDHENFELCSEDELFELAKKRKTSFVAKNDEITSVSIDAPRGFSRLFVDSTLAGYIIIRDRRLGRLTLEVHDQAALSVAVDALPRRFGDRCFVNVELDRNTAKFVPLGR
jgi:hypothetical protein